MDSLLNLFVGDLVLSPDLLFVARCLCIVLIVNVLTSFVSVIVPLAKSVR